MVSVMLYHCILCVCFVNRSVYLVCCVFDSVCELFGEKNLQYVWVWLLFCC